MAVLALDTLKATGDLTTAGAAAPLAEAIVETVNAAVNEGVATKADVAEARAALKTDVSEAKVEIKADSAATRAEPKEEIAEVRADNAVLKTDVAVLKTDVARLDGNVWAIEWAPGFVFLLTLAMAARLFDVV